MLSSDYYFEVEHYPGATCVIAFKNITNKILMTIENGFVDFFYVFKTILIMRISSVWY